jgi:hypothetical protein
LHTDALPVIVPGVAGMLIEVTSSVCGADEPQALFAVTVIVPLRELAVVVMFLVAEVPVQPPGSVHV